MLRHDAHVVDALRRRGEDRRVVRKSRDELDGKGRYKRYAFPSEVLAKEIVESLAVDEALIGSFVHGHDRNLLARTLDTISQIYVVLRIPRTEKREVLWRKRPLITQRVAGTRPEMHRKHLPSRYSERMVLCLGALRVFEATFCVGAFADDDLDQVGILPVGTEELRVVWRVDGGISHFLQRQELKLSSMSAHIEWYRC